MMILDCEGGLGSNTGRGVKVQSTGISTEQKTAKKAPNDARARDPLDTQPGRREIVELLDETVRSLKRARPKDSQAARAASEKARTIAYVSSVKLNTLRDWTLDSLEARLTALEEQGGKE